MTRGQLEQIYNLRLEIEEWKARLAEAEEEPSVKSPVVDSMPKSQSRPELKGNDIVANMDIKKEYPERIKKCIEKLERERDEVIEYINNIQDSLLRRIITFRFIENNTWSEVADRCKGNNTESSVKKIYYRHWR